MKLIIDIPEEVYKAYCASTYCINDMIILENEVRNGTPLDDVKAEIKNEYYTEKEPSLYQAGTNFGLSLAVEILDNIGKAESEEE